MNPADRKDIEHFVRRTLGCKCPSEVFQAISIERSPASDTLLPRTRLVVGNRLLIDVVEGRTAKSTASAVSRLTTEGRSERDAKHLNRYRLVVACDHPTQVLTDARTSFAHAAGDDDRVHLHVVATDQLPDAMRRDMVPVASRAPGISDTCDRAR